MESSSESEEEQNRKKFQSELNTEAESQGCGGRADSTMANKGSYYLRTLSR